MCQIDLTQTANDNKRAPISELVDDERKVYVSVQKYASRCNVVVIVVACPERNAVDRAIDQVRRLSRWALANG